MTNTIQAIRGMNDILPNQTAGWYWMESNLREIISSYGYQEIRLPIVEKTELFRRSIGDVTDIVEKEMYTFLDRNGDSLSLRPEGTAGCVRAGIEHGLLYNQIQRLWYMGPMFRHERPQKGRYRQFYQIGVEAFGLAGPDIDVELILMTARFWQRLGISQYVELQLNSLGSANARKTHRESLVSYFSKHQAQLDEDSQKRLHTNPLRILDSKNPALQSLIADAPQLLDYLDEESKAHFAAVRQLLDAAGVRYTINPRLVRGLDYYNKTVFEWVTEELGAQGTVCGGGRYDGLVELLNGASTPAVGFAMGLERLLTLLQTHHIVTETAQAPHIYVIMVGDAALQHGLLLAEKLRTQFPVLRIATNCGGGSFKTQFKRADKSGATLALVLGDDEIANNTTIVKYLREEKPQQAVELAQLMHELKQLTSD